MSDSFVETKQPTLTGRNLLTGGLAILLTFILSYAAARWFITRDGLSNETIWYAIRASGVVAYLFLLLSTVWGIILTSKIVKEWVPAPVSLALHNYLSWNAIGLTILHAVLLLFSDFFNYSLMNLLVPFTGPFMPFWVGLGIIGLYLMVLTSVTFYLIQRIGQKTFRAIHYLSYLAFVGVTLHSWVAGTDNGILGNLYLGSGLLVVFLTSYRVLNVRNNNPALT